MIIDKSILEAYRGQCIPYKKNEYIFHEEDTANFYYQVLGGCVKMSSFNDDGKEFTQGMFYEGESFGEPALFGDFPFPNNAIAVEDSEVCKVPKDAFFDILRDHFDIHLKFTKTLSTRLKYKGMLLKEISSYHPDHIIMTFLRHLKNTEGAQGEEFGVDFTRQQLADMTGLRVETVIRTVKKLEREEALTLKGSKIFI